MADYLIIYAFMEKPCRIYQVCTCFLVHLLLVDRWTAAQPEAREAAAIPQPPPPPHPPRNEDKGLAQPTGPLAGRLRLWVPRATGAPPAGGAPLRQPESPQTAVANQKKKTVGGAER